MFPGNSQARTDPAVLSMEFWSRHQHCPLCFFKECCALFSIHLDEQEKSRLDKCLSFEGCNFLIIMLTHTEPSGALFGGGEGVTSQQHPNFVSRFSFLGS